MRTTYAALVAGIAMLPVRLASAAPVIPPGQEELVRRMLGNGPEAAAPWPNGCSATSIAIQQDHIAAHVDCAGRTWTIILRHESNSAGSAFRTKQFAVSFVSDASTEPSFNEVVRARIVANEGSFKWIAAASSFKPPSEEPAKPFPRFSLPSGPGVVFSAFMLGPVVIGAVLGAVLRRARRSRAIAVAALVAAAPLLAGLWQTTFSVCDLFWVSIGTALSALAVVLPARLDRALLARGLLAALTLALSVCALELVARRVAAKSNYIPGEGDPRVRFQPWEREIGCESIYPDAFRELYFIRMRDLSRVPRVPGRTRIVHLGDSMVDAGELPLSDAFTGKLDAQHGDQEHLNLGVSNTGTDAHYAIFDRWVPRLRPDLVVLHVFPGNDLSEIDRSFVCAGSGPLLDYEPNPHLRFAQPSFHVSQRVLFGRGPSPFVVRYLAKRSAAARGVAAGMERLFHIGDGPSGPQQWEHFERLIDAIQRRAKQEKVPLLTVVLPVRGDVESAARSGGSGRNATTERMLEALRARGLEPLDATPLFLERLRADPSRRWFRPAAFNPHFDVDGHEAYARWIEPAIERALHP